MPDPPPNSSLDLLILLIQRAAGTVFKTVADVHCYEQASKINYRNEVGVWKHGRYTRTLAHIYRFLLPNV